MDKLWSRKIRVIVMEKPWKVPGRFVDTNVAIPWTFPDAAEKLPGCYADATRDAMPDAAWTATAIAKSSANHRANFGADIHRRLVRCFPLTARMRLGNCPDANRILPG
jgi:hypothetical protein